MTQMKGLSQKTLGVKCGWNSDPSVEARISRYEQNKNVPNKASVNALAKALDAAPNGENCFAKKPENEYAGLLVRMRKTTGGESYGI